MWGKMNDAKGLLEPEIKAMLAGRLLARGYFVGDAVLINEFTVDGSSRRADLVVANTRLHAFEIKSSSDSLERLPGQLETYQRFFDKVTLVVAPCHEDKVLSMAQDAIAVWRVDDSGELRILRRGRCLEVRDRDALVSLLQVSDLRSVLRKAGVSPLPRLRADLVAATQNLPIARLRKAVLGAIKNRYADTTRVFLREIGNGPVCREHLEKLSHYIAVRRHFEERTRIIEEKWKAWIESLPLLPDDCHLARWANSMPHEPFGPVPQNIRVRVLMGDAQSSQSSSVS